MKSQDNILSNLWGPQSSIIWLPAIFLIIIIHSPVNLFADDTKCYKCPSDAVLLQHDLNTLSVWTKGLDASF